jgi:hypothetical protein
MSMHLHSHRGTANRSKSPACWNVLSLLMTIALLSPQLFAVLPAQAAGGAYSIKWYAADPAVNRAPYLPTLCKTAAKLPRLSCCRPERRRGTRGGSAG